MNSGTTKDSQSPCTLERGVKGINGKLNKELIILKTKTGLTCREIESKLKPCREGGYELNTPDGSIKLDISSKSAIGDRTLGHNGKETLAQVVVRDYLKAKTLTDGRKLTPRQLTEIETWFNDNILVLTQIRAQTLGQERDTSKRETGKTACLSEWADWISLLR